MRVDWPLRTITFVGAVFLLCGCPNPNMYTTPRTIAPGAVQWQVAPEVIGVSYDVKTANAQGTTQTTTETGFAPMVPSFGARIGLADNIDLGLRLQNLDSIAADGKFLLVKGNFDVALDPGLQGYYVSVNGVGAGVVYLHAPVLLGLNLSQNVSLVLSPGFVFSVASATFNGASGVTGAASATGFMGRLGLGFDFRITPKFSIHPELTVMKQFNDVNALIYVGGVGFNIGAHPDYSDLAQGGPTSPPAAGH
jgi:hypothetical protein